MHFVLITVMVVLLPLRGWAGDIMAVNMAASAVDQAKISTIVSQASMPADCAMHANQSTDDASLAQCDKCDTCELCLAVANIAFANWVNTQQPRHSAPMAFDASFSNAVKAMNLKPPIS